MNDTDTIRQVLDGGVEAFAVLVSKYHGPCVRYARQMLRNRELAEDAVQDTFIRAYRGLRGYDDRGQFAAWLFRILVNRCRSAIRTEMRRAGWTPIEELPESTTPSAPQPDSVTRLAVEAALTRLGAEQREAFLLRHVEQMSYEEMAFVTGAGVSALKMRVSRAVEALRKELAHDAD